MAKESNVFIGHFTKMPGWSHDAEKIEQLKAIAADLWGRLSNEPQK